MHRDLRDGGKHGCSHGYACRGAVLGHGAFRNMDMDVILREEFRFNAVVFRNGPEIADTGYCGFLHHIAQVTGELEIAFSGHDIDFDLQNFAAHAGPGKAGNDTNLGLAVHLGYGSFCPAEELFQIPYRNGYLLKAVLLNLQRGFAADGAELAFQLTDAGFPGIARDNLFNGFVGNDQFLFLDAVGKHLLRNQVLLRNVNLLVFRIAADLDNLHPVQQGLGNGGSVIGRSDEQHLGKIDGDFDIMVGEPDVLLRIQHFQKR